MVDVNQPKPPLSREEQARQRSQAGVKGMQARWGNKPEPETPPPPLTPEQERALAAAAPKLLPPASWREAYQRQQAGVAALKREKLALEIESMKRERIPLIEVREFMARIRALVLRELATLPGLAEKIPDARSHQIDALRRELATFSEAFRKTISETDL